MKAGSLKGAKSQNLLLIIYYKINDENFLCEPLKTRIKLIFILNSENLTCVNDFKRISINHNGQIDTYVVIILPELLDK